MYNDPTYIPTSKVLNKICNTYKIQPGAFLVWEPDDEPRTAVIKQEQFEESEQQGKGIGVDVKPQKSKRACSFLAVIIEAPESA